MPHQRLSTLTPLSEKSFFPLPPHSLITSYLLASFISSPHENHLPILDKFWWLSRYRPSDFYVFSDGISRPLASSIDNRWKKNVNVLAARRIGVTCIRSSQLSFEEKKMRKLKYLKRKYHSSETETCDRSVYSSTQCTRRANCVGWGNFSIRRKIWTLMRHKILV